MDPEEVRTEPEGPSDHVLREETGISWGREGSPYGDAYPDRGGLNLPGYVKNEKL